MMYAFIQMLVILPRRRFTNLSNTKSCDEPSSSSSSEIAIHGDISLEESHLELKDDSSSRFTSLTAKESENRLSEKSTFESAENDVIDALNISEADFIQLRNKKSLMEFFSESAESMTCELDQYHPSNNVTSNPVFKSLNDEFGCVKNKSDIIILCAEEKELDDLTGSEISGVTQESALVSAEKTDFDFKQTLKKQSMPSQLSELNDSTINFRKIKSSTDEPEKHSKIDDSGLSTCESPTFKDISNVRIPTNRILDSNLLSSESLSNIEASNPSDNLSQIHAEEYVECGKELILSTEQRVVSLIRFSREFCFHLSEVVVLFRLISMCKKSEIAIPDKIIYIHKHLLTYEKEISSIYVNYFHNIVKDFDRFNSIFTDSEAKISDFRDVDYIMAAFQYVYCLYMQRRDIVEKISRFSECYEPYNRELIILVSPFDHSYSSISINDQEKANRLGERLKQKCHTILMGQDPERKLIIGVENSLGAKEGYVDQESIVMNGIKHLNSRELSKNKVNPDSVESSRKTIPKISLDEIFCDKKYEKSDYYLESECVIEEMNKLCFFTEDEFRALKNIYMLEHKLTCFKKINPSHKTIKNGYGKPNENIPSAKTIFCASNDSVTHKNSSKNLEVASEQQNKSGLSGNGFAHFNDGIPGGSTKLVESASEIYQEKHISNINKNPVESLEISSYSQNAEHHSKASADIFFESIKDWIYDETFKMAREHIQLKITSKRTFNNSLTIFLNIVDWDDLTDWDKSDINFGTAEYSNGKFKSKTISHLKDYHQRGFVFLHKNYTEERVFHRLSEFFRGCPKLVYCEMKIEAYRHSCVINQSEAGLLTDDMICMCRTRDSTDPINWKCAQSIELPKGPRKSKNVKVSQFNISTVDNRDSDISDISDTQLQKKTHNGKIGKKGRKGRTEKSSHSKLIPTCDKTSLDGTQKEVQALENQLNIDENDIITAGHASNVTTSQIKPSKDAPQSPNQFLSRSSRLNNLESVVDAQNLECLDPNATLENCIAQNNNRAKVNGHQSREKSILNPKEVFCNSSVISKQKSSYIDREQITKSELKTLSRSRSDKKPDSLLQNYHKKNSDDHILSQRTSIQLVKEENTHETDSGDNSEDEHNEHIFCRLLNAKIAGEKKSRAETMFQDNQSIKPLLTTAQKRNIQTTKTIQASTALKNTQRYTNVEKRTTDKSDYVIKENTREKSQVSRKGQVRSISEERTHHCNLQKEGGRVKQIPYNTFNKERYLNSTIQAKATQIPVDTKQNPSFIFDKPVSMPFEAERPSSVSNRMILKDFIPITSSISPESSLSNPVSHILDKDFFSSDKSESLYHQDGSGISDASCGARYSEITKKNTGVTLSKTEFQDPNAILSGKNYDSNISEIMGYQRPKNNIQERNKDLLCPKTDVFEPQSVFLGAEDMIFDENYTLIPSQYSSCEMSSSTNRDLPVDHLKIRMSDHKTCEQERIDEQTMDILQPSFEECGSSSIPPKFISFWEKHFGEDRPVAGTHENYNHLTMNSNPNSISIASRTDYKSKEIENPTLFSDNDPHTEREFSFCTDHVVQPSIRLDSHNNSEKAISQDVSSVSLVNARDPNTNEKPDILSAHPSVSFYPNKNLPGSVNAALNAFDHSQDVTKTQPMPHDHIDSELDEISSLIEKLLARKSSLLHSRNQRNQN